MEPTIAAALITGAVTILALVITNNYQNRRIVQLMEIKLALINQTIQTLSDRVDKHNSVVDRTYKLEEQTALLAQDSNVANHRIKDLEEKAE